MEKSKKEDYVTVCPKCGSNRIRSETDPAYVWSGLSNTFKECENCGHRGIMFPEVPRSEIKTIKTEKLKNKKLLFPVLVQTSFSRGYWKYVKYIILPLVLLVVILYFLGIL